MRQPINRVYYFDLSSHVPPTHHAQAVEDEQGDQRPHRHTFEQSGHVGEEEDHDGKAGR